MQPKEEDLVSKKPVGTLGAEYLVGLVLVFCRVPLSGRKYNCAEKWFKMQLVNEDLSDQ